MRSSYRDANASMPDISPEFLSLFHQENGSRLYDRNVIFSAEPLTFAFASYPSGWGERGAQAILNFAAKVVKILLDFRVLCAVRL